MSTTTLVKTHKPKGSRPQTRLFKNLKLDLHVTSQSASPREGASLANLVNIHGENIRAAVNTLTEATPTDLMWQTFNTLFNSPPIENTTLSSSDLRNRLAWNLVSLWLIKKRLSPAAQTTFDTAIKWFTNSPNDSKYDYCLPSRIFPKSCLIKAENTLNASEFTPAFWDLLPYILELHGPGSRASVLRDPNTRLARQEKRKNGVFYTPADVAMHMVGNVSTLYRGNFLKAKVLDPACGTGVFLLSILKHTTERANGLKIKFDKLRYITSSLYGLDICPHALDSAAFVLLNECHEDSITNKISPWAAWHLIRLNLIQQDALRITTPSSPNSEAYRRNCTELTKTKQNLFATRTYWDVASHSAPSTKTEEFPNIFPLVNKGFDIIIGNPPYSKAGERTDFERITSNFQSLKNSQISSSTNIYPLFIELLIRFSNKCSHAAALVTPLSIAYNKTSIYTGCRSFMSATPGKWQFEFFDREPHALFGEEVKTRNSIIYHSQSPDKELDLNKTFIETGPMLRWTSRSRARLFKSIRYTPLIKADISEGIPKLGGKLQAEVFDNISKHFGTFNSFFQYQDTSPTTAIFGTNKSTVFIGGTAYNFINAYKSIPNTEALLNLNLTDSPVHTLTFKSEPDADIALAILNSKLTFWLWHVLEDGFHVSARFISKLPFEKSFFNRKDLSRLSELGNLIWQKARGNQFISHNRQKHTIGFKPTNCSTEISHIDKLLVERLNLPATFSSELAAFHASLVI